MPDSQTNYSDAPEMPPLASEVHVGRFYRPNKQLVSLRVDADVLAWSLFSMWVMGQYGTRAMAANTYMMRYMVVSFMPAFGVATAVTALVGRYIGRGEPDTAARRGIREWKIW